MNVIAFILFYEVANGNRGMDKDVVHIYSGTLAIKKNEILPFAATWIDVEVIMLSEVSHTGKEKYCMTSIICGI